MTDAASSAPPAFRRSVLTWALVLVASNLILFAWLFRAVNPWRLLFELYSFQEGMPPVYRLPAGFLALGISFVLLKNKRAAAFTSITNFFSTLPGLIACALLSLLLLLALGTGFQTNLARAALSASVFICAAGIGLRVLEFRLIKLDATRFESPVEQLVLASALGLGALGLSVFVLGSMGVMNPWFWRVAIFGLCAANFKVLRGLIADLFRATRKRVVEAPPFVLIAAIFIACFLAAHAPLIWNLPASYDVLEYHLAAPAQYLRAGSISFLHENTYATLPENGETLFLLGMLLAGGKFEGLPCAHGVLLGAWVLSVLGVYALARRLERSFSHSPDRAASPAPIAAAGLYVLTPMASQVAADFYVEHFQALAHISTLLCASAFLSDFKIRQLFKAHARNSAASWLLCAGAMAGLCCGEKVTALLFTMLPLLLFLPAYCALTGSLMDGLATLLRLGLPALAVYAPWAIRNLIASGDPLYPLGLALRRRLSGANGIPDKLDHFEAAHQAGEISWASALATLRQILPGFQDRGADDDARISRFLLFGRDNIALGPQLCFFAAPGVALADNAEMALLVFVFAADMLLWFFASLHNTRFVYPHLAALAVLGGLGLARVWRAPALRSMAAGLCCVAVLVFAPLQLSWVWLFSSRESVMNAEKWTATSKAQFGEEPPYFMVGGLIQSWLPANSRVLFIGEAQTFYCDQTPSYSVVFNTSLLEEALHSTQSAAEAAAYLRARGITHLYFNYPEWLRLDTSYALKLSTDGKHWKLVQWGDEPLKTTRARMEASVRERDFQRYSAAWPENIYPAYLKLTAKEYERFGELFQNLTRPIWPAQPGALEVRELRP